MNKQPRASLTVGISCAFEENAVRALSTYASSHNFLLERVVPNRTLSLIAAEIASRLPGIPEGARRYVARTRRNLSLGTLSADMPGSIASEVFRIAGGHRVHLLSSFLGNYLWKAMFDYTCRRKLRKDLSVVIGMPGSCLRTFESMPDTFKVFHAIDAHPRSRNDALLRTYGRRRARAELYPARFVSRMEVELELADMVLVASELAATQMLEHGVNPAKIVCVPYAVDSETFQYDPLASHGNKSSSRLRALCVAQVSLRKGIPVLLSAVEGLPVDLTLVGQVFDQRILRNLPSNVTLRGSLSKKELIRAYANADVFVLPTIEDICSLVVAEAATAGLPVITTTANGAKELLGKSHSIIEPGNVEVLRQALATAATPSDEVRAKISQEMREMLGEGDSANTPWERYAAMVFGEIAHKQR